MTHDGSARKTWALEALFDADARSLQVRVATAIGAAVGLLFAIFNLLSPGQTALGLVELGAVLLLVAPAFVLSTRPRWLRLAESLLLLASTLIFGALLVLGGVAGTGLFWVFTVPTLAYFLAGPRIGTLYSLGFLLLAALYLRWGMPALPFAYRYPPEVAGHFLLALIFYTLISGSFTYVRLRFAQQLRQARDTADQALTDLRQAQQATEAAYAAKSRFLAAASHDLRQPIQALGLYAAQLPRDAASIEVLDGLDASIGALQEMLDVFFDYSRLDPRSAVVQRRPVPLESLFDQLRTCFEPLAAQKGLHLRVQGEPVWVYSDPVLLQRILLNLVSNAVRYTVSGSILVRCLHGDSQVRIEVRDSGIGIAPEHQDRVFEEFYQVDNRARNRNQGLGLGLSMVRRASELLQHPLTLRSQLGQGSCFTLSLPLAQPAEQPAAPQDLDRAAA